MVVLFQFSRFRCFLLKIIQYLCLPGHLLSRLIWTRDGEGLPLNRCISYTSFIHIPALVRPQPSSLQHKSKLQISSYFGLLRRALKLTVPPCTCLSESLLMLESTPSQQRQRGITVISPSLLDHSHLYILSFKCPALTSQSSLAVTYFSVHPNNQCS